MDQSRLTSLSLLEGLVNNDDHSWKRLDSLYGPFVDYWIRESGVVNADAQDLRQEVLRAVSNSINNYKHSESESGSLRRWIWGIARNKITDYRQRRRKSVIASGGTAALEMVKALVRNRQHLYAPSGHLYAPSGQDVRTGFVEKTRCLKTWWFSVATCFILGDGHSFG